MMGLQNNNMHAASNGLNVLGGGNQVVTNGYTCPWCGQFVFYAGLGHSCLSRFYPIAYPYLFQGVTMPDIKLGTTTHTISKIEKDSQVGVILITLDTGQTLRVTQSDAFKYHVGDEVQETWIVGSVVD